MSSIERKKIECIKCKKESEQDIIYSINPRFYTKEKLEELKNYKQKCPYCGYTAKDISKKQTILEKLFKK